MRIAVSGSSGMVGRFLIPSLATEGHEIVRLVRRRVSERKKDVMWSPEEGWIDCDKMGAVDAAIHLAGENIAGGKWTDERKASIRNSRIEGTALLAAAMKRQRPKPKVVICASAVGYYGNRGDEELTEESSPGTGFLADVCREWEEAAAVLPPAGIRTAHLRFGVILSGHGGALQKMLPPFRWGLGGVLGDGSQYMSWVSIRDVVRSIRHILFESTLSGPINVTGPEPVTNREFTKSLGHNIRRPTVFPVPAPVLRTLFGEMADETLLASTRAIPAKLQADGFQFTHNDVDAAIRSALHQRGEERV